MITEITIKGTAHPFRYGYGALMFAEELLGHPWGTLQNSRANFILFFSCFVNADTNFPYTFEQLLDACDEDHSIVQAMGDALSAQLERWGKPSKVEEADDKKKG